MNLVEIALQHTGPFFLLAFFIVGAGALVWFYYRRTEPAVRRWRKIFLGIIRSIALLSGFLLLLEPVLSVTWEYSRPPHGAFLIDESSSMNLTDRRGQRSSLTDSLLKSEDTRRFMERFKPDLLAFGKGVRPLAAIDSLRWNVEGTNIASALNFLKSQKPENAYDFAVLITDGAYNLGENPFTSNKEFGIPVHTIAVGDSGGQVDVLIHHIIAPEVVYADQKISMQVAIRAQGVEGKRVNVTLREKGASLASKLIELPKEGRETVVSFDLAPSKEGIHEYLAEISGTPGEITDQNNRQSFFIKVLKSKTKVLIIAGKPTPDFGFAMRALSGDPHITVKGIVEESEGKFFTQDAAVKDFDPEAVILINYPSDRSSPALRTQIQELLKNSHLPFSVIGGKETSPNTVEYYRSIVPLAVKNIWNREQEVLLQLTPDGLEHPVFQLEDVPGGIQQTLPALPPIFFNGKYYTDLPHQKTLAILDAPRSGLGSTGQEIPLIASAVADGRKCLFFNVYGIWKWDLALHNDSPSVSFYGALWSGIIRWLMRKDDERLVRIRPDKETYRSGDEIAFNASVYDEKYQPLDGALVKVSIKDSAGAHEILMRSDGNGRYSGAIEIIQPGAYTYEGKATLNNRVLGADSGDFRIGAFSLEMLEPARNSKVLQELSQSTGGHYYSDVSLASLNKDIPYSLKTLTKSSKLDFWNSFVFLLIITGSLGLEWFLRKIWGML